MEKLKAPLTINLFLNLRENLNNYKIFGTDLRNTIKDNMFFAT